MTLFYFTFLDDTYYIRFGFWLLCLPVLLWHLLRSPFIIAEQWVGSKERAIARTRQFGLLLLLTILIYWAQGALARANPSECFVEGPSGAYEAEICITGGSVQDANTEGIVRLRSTKDGTVLAEDEFHNPSFTNVHWGEDLLTVGAGTGSAHINLPPTWLDRLRAKLP